MDINGEIKSIPFWVILICLATVVFGIAGHALWTADEPREAEIAREMSEVIRKKISGDDSEIRTSWAIPFLAGKPFVEKPPLYYWLSALMMLTIGKLIGLTVAARAFSALCALLTLVVVWIIGKKYLGKNRAAIAAVILVTMAGFFQAGHWILIDPLLMLLVTAAVLLYFHGFEDDQPVSLLVAYLCAGLAFLTKGFVAWGVLFIPWLYILVEFRRKIPGKLILHLISLLLLFGPALIWALAFYNQGGPELWNEWFVNNQIGRFSGQTTHSHIHGPFYYLGIIPVVLAPWIIIPVVGLFRCRRSVKKEGSSGERKMLRLSLAWAVGGFILLSLAGTKRDIYLYPLLPGFAFLCVYSLERLPSWVDTVYRVLCPVLLLPVIALAFISPVIGEGKFSIVWNFKPMVVILSAIGIFAIFRLDKNLVARIAAVTGIFYLTAVFTVFPLIDEEKNYEPATRAVAASIPETLKDRICGWHTDETTRAIFSYYTGLTLNELRDKLEPEKNLDRLARILNGEDPEYSLVLVLLKQENNFPPAGMPPASYRKLTEEKMGPRRRLLLLAGRINN